MTEIAHPRRSVLYMPGSKARALEKARTLPADGLILDLEDAVGPAEKEIARGMISEAVRAGGYGRREVVIRINALSTPWGAEDLKMAAEAGPDAVLVPKVETPEMVREVEIRLQAHGAPDRTQIWAMMETPLAKLKAESIASSTPRLTCMVMGTNDLVKELKASHTETRLPVITALGLCMLAARGHGLSILDGVHNIINDDKGLRSSCIQGREMGFDGKTLIHPSQIAIANEVFSPSEADLALARRYVAAFEEAEREGRGVTVVDGQLVENLHVEDAKRLIAMAAAISEIEAAA